MLQVLLVITACVLLVVPVVEADCPSNGNTHAIYITSNMGNNIWSFDTQGTYIGEVINKASFPQGVEVGKLRAMRFGPGGHLYVSSASGSFSRIFAISGNGLLNRTLQANCTRQYLFTVTKQEDSNPLLDHPYDMVFHPKSEDLFVSNQNTMTVTKYLRKAVKYGESALPHPRWEPAANVKGAMPGASVVDEEEGTPVTVQSNAGLFVSSWSRQYSLSSVRGLAISPRLPKSLVDGSAPPGLFSVDGNETMAYYLLVCDLAMNMVHVFNPDTGDHLFDIPVPAPIQVVFPARFYRELQESVSLNGGRVYEYEMPYIYVTSKDDGMAYMVPFTSHTSSIQSAGKADIFSEEFSHTHRLYSITRHTPLHAASGLCEHPSRDIIFVADRTGRRVSSYASPFVGNYTHSAGPSPYLGSFTRRLPDQPEFIISVLLESQENIPFCYELAPDGRFRYVALCTAAYIWSIALMILLTVVPMILTYRQVQHCLRKRRRRKRSEAGTGAISEEAPLLKDDNNHTYGTSARKDV